MALASMIFKWVGIAVVVVVVQYVVAYFSSPLKKLPGPFLAKFSNVWRLINHYSKTHIETQKELHAKYGEVVRIGPNTVSLSDPSLVKKIYTTRGTFIKSDYYTVNDALQDGKIIQNIFSTRSNEFHSRALRPVQKLYSQANGLELEQQMNDILHTLCQQLEQRFMDGRNKGKTCDIANWISYFTWDFLGDMTFSNRMGFLEQGKDVDGILQGAEDVMRYFSVIGQIPILDKWLGKNPFCPIKFADFAVPAGFCVQHFVERAQNLEQFKDKKDFMNLFLEAKKEYPDIVTDNEVIGYLIINILGGADTTAIVLKAIFYYLLKNPSAKHKLVAELRSSSLPFPAAYQTVENLPYLDACIKEGLRIHPVVGHILERIVPSNGLSLSDGTILPPGTIVGLNPWVVHRNKEVFGENTDDFVPERWLRKEGEVKEEYEMRTNKMKDADMSFGNGNRTCLGRPLALIELYKFVATLFAKYQIDLEDPKQEWELHKQWFVLPHNVKVKMCRY